MSDDKMRPYLPSDPLVLSEGVKDALRAMDEAEEFERFKARVAKLLREIEWAGTDECSGQECPSCRAYHRDPHSEFCELAALLREAEGG